MLGSPTPHTKDNPEFWHWQKFKASHSVFLGVHFIPMIYIYWNSLPWQPIFTICCFANLNLSQCPSPHFTIFLKSQCGVRRQHTGRVHTDPGSRPPSPSAGGRGNGSFMSGEAVLQVSLSHLIPSQFVSINKKKRALWMLSSGKFFPWPTTHYSTGNFTV